MKSEEITKSLPVSKRMVWEAYKQVRSNRGSAGIDKQSMEMFDADLSKNLYKIWNRMSSGSYFPPAVRTVFIPKKQGGKRPLGIPTVGDRIAQTVLKQHVESSIDAVFHSSSFGYRPNRHAHGAVAQCEQHCRAYAWVIDLDIKGYFDNIDHDILLELLSKHITEKWVLMYLTRWLKAGVEQEDGSIKQRERGTPQGGVISPLLANLYLHHAFDLWMREQNPHAPFERYADDIVVHCHNKAEAERLLAAIRTRMQEYKLELHPEKTRIVYCKDYRRKEKAEHESFNFLGFTLQPRTIKSKIEGRFVVFKAAISNAAKKNIREAVKEILNRNRHKYPIEWFAEMLNPKIRGWVNYYGAFMMKEVKQVLTYINTQLVSWIKNVYKITGIAKAYRKLRQIQSEKPNLFYHWKIGITYD
jgi:group II intron reverse transcriptase/maturase